MRYRWARWKLKHVQTALVEAVEKTRFLDPECCVVLLSDHKNRIGLSYENFYDERYHNLMFAITFKNIAQF
jgi:hypothetical protein